MYGPPPPYEKVEPMSRLSKLSEYVWKRASFSSTVPTTTPVKLPLPEEGPSIFDKKQLEHALVLLNIATEMNRAGNQQMALDLYMMGLDRMFSALPLDTDPTVKAALEKTIIEFKTRKDLDLTTPPKIESRPAEGQEEQKDVPSNLSNLVISAAVLGAVALKKSPIPNALSTVLAYAKSGLQTVDETCKIRERAWGIASQGVAKAIEVDQYYEIHQTLTEVVCTGCTALLKAGIAYSETPGYKEPL
ncbi:hypothetical protein DFQ28_008754 [Apophysomyces sp. BC1034]|nr:hypothetical protein DFQ30_004973 [Apophysomyces sp. BC1015]KAG0174557.1 hypothetical protein DFQ29_007438 [Apophysomyces sp. BC1021]KAG0185793.1 hypothetical protein DFQ28_008754 [Apophysomyces sp. BC1034]